MAKSNAKKKPQVQIINPTPEPITELELLGIETDRRRVAAASALLNEASAKLEQAEVGLIKRLKAGAAVLSQAITATVEAVPGPSRPKWKDEYVKHFETEHGETQAAIETRLKKKYPGKAQDTLVIGLKAPVK